VRQCLVAQHSREEGKEPQIGLSLRRPLVCGVLAVTCYLSNSEEQRAKPKVIHVDRLKLYLRPALREGRETVVLAVVSPVVSAERIYPGWLCVS